MTGAELLLIALAERLQLRHRLIAIDVETTGTDPQTDRIVQIAGYVVDPVRQGDGVGYHVEAIGPHLVNPRRPIPAEATEVHHVTDAMVANAPTFAALVPMLAPHIDADPAPAIVAYNGRFDIRFLAAELTRAGATDAAAVLGEALLLDPYRIYQRQHPRDLSAAVRQYCGRELGDEAHDAHADVVAAVEVLMEQLSKHGDLPATVADLEAYCAQRDPAWIDKAGKFIWRDGVPHCNFGSKWKGVPMHRVDRTFYAWMCRSDFDPDTKQIAELAARGYYPERPKVQAAS